MLLKNVSPYDLLSWCLYRGEVVEMDIWSWIFADKFRMIFKVCVRRDRGRRGVNQMWTDMDKGEGCQKSEKMCGHPL